jgi:hypothetical protein
LPGQHQRVFGWHDAKLLTILVDDADGANADLVVDTKRSCYGLPSGKSEKKKKTAVPKHPAHDKPRNAAYVE